jgi:hypothetical protein
MKTFLFPFVFAAVILGFAVSVSADTTLFDWEDPGNAIVFATEISGLSHGERPVEIDYAIKDNVLYSRVTFSDNGGVLGSDLVQAGFKGLNIFGGYERAVGNPQDNNQFFYRDNSSNFWTYYEYAATNDDVYAAYLQAEGAFAKVFASGYLSDTYDEGWENSYRNYFTENIVKESGSLVDGVDMFTKYESAAYWVDEEAGISNKNIGTFMEGTDFEATYLDGVLTISANDNFLFSLNYVEGNDYFEYAFSLDGLGLDHYNGIHIGSQRENYYTFLDFSEGTFHAGTPEPATALILGLAGSIAIPLLRRKTKK